MAPKDYYQILGVDRNATDKEIRQAYRNLAASLQAEGGSSDNVTLEKIQDINKAYEILSDPNDRKEYDAQMDSSADKSEPITPIETASTLTGAAMPKKKRNRGALIGVVVNLLMLVFGVIIGFVGRPIVMPPPDPQAAMLQKVIDATRHFKGNANAPVTIIEFADFQ